MTIGVIASMTNSVASLMTPLIYTGDGSSSHAITGVGFQPNLVWMKQRDSGSQEHVLMDDVRGVQRKIESNTSDAELLTTGYLSSFDSDGFTLGSSGVVNDSGGSYVAWCFKEDPEVFDIVGYTGTGLAHTEAHNMSVAPEMILVKSRDSVNNWHCYHSQLNAGTSPEDYYIRLNTSGTEASATSLWDDTAPTSSVFTVGTSDESNKAGDDFISYLFASKAGVSKVGAYSGTGVSGNAITGLGFAPSFLLIKQRTGGTESWMMFDAARGNSKSLEANLPDAEESTFNVTLDTDGFTLNSTDGKVNQSGTNNYIYLALA